MPGLKAQFPSLAPKSAMVADLLCLLGLSANCPRGAAGGWTRAYPTEARAAWPGGAPLEEL